MEGRGGGWGGGRMGVKWGWGLPIKKGEFRIGSCEAICPAGNGAMTTRVTPRQVSAVTPGAVERKVFGLRTRQL